MLKFYRESKTHVKYDTLPMCCKISFHIKLPKIYFKYLLIVFKEKRSVNKKIIECLDNEIKRNNEEWKKRQKIKQLKE